MKLRNSGRLLTISSLACLAGVTGSCEKKVQHPNILLIMADDMGYSDLGCYGGEIATPSIDLLAENGLRFTQFYNNARSCPTRAGLLTGLYPHQAGIGYMVSEDRGRGYEGNLNDNCVTIAEVLREAGYYTIMTGKWHLSRSITPDDKGTWPLQRGFDTYYGTIDGAGSFYQPHSLTYNNEQVAGVPEGYYYTDAISDSTVAFIERHGRKGKRTPFFAYVSYTAPHWPLHAPEDVIVKYQKLYEEGWDRLREARMNRMISEGLVREDWQLSARDVRVSRWEEIADKPGEARKMAVYAAQVEIMDSGIGRIMDQLEKSGLKENTIVIFLMDNGGCAETFNSGTEWIRRYGPEFTLSGDTVLYGNDAPVQPGPDNSYQSYGIAWANLSNTPFRYYKHSAYEGGIATPLIVHWPSGIKGRGRLVTTISGIIDIMPTVLGITGAHYPSVYRGASIHKPEGIDLSPVFRGKEIEREGCYFVEHGNARSVRRGIWKLAAQGGTSIWSLYNMENDRTETTDLSSEYPELVKELADEYELWAWRVHVLPRPR
ncbi:MAG: arylsulfatase [Bacteroidales bacterium]